MKCGKLDVNVCQESVYQTFDGLHSVTMTYTTISSNWPESGKSWFVLTLNSLSSMYCYLLVLIWVLVTVGITGVTGWAYIR